MSYQREARWPWLLFIVAAHIACIIALSSTGKRLEQGISVSSNSALLVELIFPAKPQQLIPLNTAATVMTPVTKPPILLPATKTPQSTQADTERPVTPAGSAFAITAPVISTEPGLNLNLDTRQISKDLQAQQRALPFAPKAAVPAIATLADKMAAAAIPGEVSFKTFTTADGTLITKVTSGRGSYCVIAPNPAGGATVIQREARSNRVVSCGNY
ncbi:hypothetical protein [Undibacterium sp. RuTC16W]|uniref:hypothetical protein n=1 Tax=Undibacterium sp. RuTC16W TaxID=3413048 RepID=UPI003BEFF03A